MRLLVTGSRDWIDGNLMRESLAGLPSDTEMCHGNARGADLLADAIATKIRGWKVTAYPADWATHGFRAGPIRNQQMLDDFKPDLCYAYPLPESKGTIDMIKRCKKAGVPVVVWGPMADRH